MLDRLTQTFDFQAQALGLRSERQRLIASNIANADTPGYVARDVDFAQALRQATGGLPAAQALTATRPGHIGGSGTGKGSTGAASHLQGNAALLYANPSQTNLDRNTVDMDRERASFADNSVKYEAALRFLNTNVKTTLSAITGQ